MEFTKFHEFPSLPGQAEREAFDKAMDQVDVGIAAVPSVAAGRGSRDGRSIEPWPANLGSRPQRGGAD